MRRGVRRCCRRGSRWRGARIRLARKPRPWRFRCRWCCRSRSVPLSRTNTAFSPGAGWAASQAWKVRRSRRPAPEGPERSGGPAQRVAGRRCGPGMARRPHRTGGKPHGRLRRPPGRRQRRRLRRLRVRDRHPKGEDRLRASWSRARPAAPGGVEPGARSPRDRADAQPCLHHAPSLSSGISKAAVAGHGQSAP